MTHARRLHAPRLAPVVFTLLIALCGHAITAEPPPLPGILDDELRLTPGSLESLTPTALVYRDTDGTVQELDRSRLVRWTSYRSYRLPALPRLADGDPTLVTTPPAPPTPPITPTPVVTPSTSKPLHATLTSSHLVTTDGQAWLGSLAADQNQPEALGWTVTLNGQTQTHAIPLERLRSVRLVRGKLLRMPDADPNAPPQDRVLLQGGQVLAGFLVGLTAEAVQLILDGADEPVDIPLSSIHLIKLANPATPPLPGTDYARLADGQRFAFQGLRTQANDFIGKVFPPTGEPVETRVPVRRVNTIDFHANGQRLVPLADLSYRIDQPAVVFGVPYPPVLTGDTAQLHAPLQITFELPPGTTRFAANLVLNTPGVSPAAARWADFTVRVSSPVLLEPTSEDQLTFRINADTPTAELNLAVDPGPITLTLDPAVNGPVLDRLRLLNAHALTQNDTPAP
ncbi:MAG: hypothetical protein AAF797_12125 [Planctomycetota bacterium]